ncbi:MAG: nucleoside-diphosphate kinase [Armatimonadota bacterium]
MVERTLLLVKPDGVERGLVGEILSRLERKGLRLAALKMLTPSRELAEQHYAVHRGKPFYESLLEFICSGPVVAAVVEGPDAVALLRLLMGSTRPTEAAPGTIRGDFACDTQRNLVHGSDSVETAEYEIGLWFPELGRSRRIASSSDHG